jgi:hypothetical protein
VADWRSADELLDWIVAKNQAGYQMVNSVPRLLEMKTFRAGPPPSDEAELSAAMLLHAQPQSRLLL